MLFVVDVMGRQIHVRQYISLKRKLGGGNFWIKLQWSARVVTKAAFTKESGKNILFNVLFALVIISGNSVGNEYSQLSFYTVKMNLISEEMQSRLLSICLLASEIVQSFISI